ncbi:PVC-type heme-binding CxxCH protein [Planctomycetes bacterium K23_9]|uniref:Cytochrome c n=1 Tax=Stieleria marina TaxID=1930275 RepID=A0A517NTK4_9BACT|nr:Cytochrome c [Planctomycetes bacterium K23_9]
MTKRFVGFGSFCSGLFSLGFALAIGFIAVSQSALAIDLDSAKPLEPEISEASDEAAQSAAGIKVPEGWDISVFAAEPDVANVVAFDIDLRGRIFACESFRQNRGVTDNRGHDEKWLLADLSAKTVQDRIDYHKRLLGEAAITYAQHDDRIRRLTDSNGDGVVDESHVVADGFNHIEEGTGAGVLVRGNDIYYTCIPRLWKLVDKDDDGKADERVVLSNGYGVRVAFRGHDMHGLIIGHDGRLYFSIGDRGYHVITKDGKLFADPAVGAVFRCELDGTNLEVFANGLRNPQELAFNDVGDLFSVDNNSDSGDQARIVHILQGGDTGWRMYYQYLPDRGPFNQEKIWEPFHNEQPAYIVPPIANFTDGPSGFAFYPGTGFGDQLKDKFLICDFRGGPSNSGIRSFDLQPDGAFYQLGEDDQPIWTCLATDLAFGPDGALYVSDWVDGWEGLGKGRIYRLTDPEHINSDIVRDVQERLQCDWDARSNESLLGDLQHADRRVRLEAQWQLAKRDEIDALALVLTQKDLPRVARLHAIWGLDQIQRRLEQDNTLKFVRPLLKDKDAYIRSAAAKFAGERGDKAAVADLRLLLKDASARANYFATIALGQLKDSESTPSVVKILADNKNEDPALRHAGVMFLTSSAKPTEITALKTHPSSAVRRAAVVALRRTKSELVAEFLSDGNSLVKAEAARAIHDVPILVAMPKLAQGLQSEATDLAFIRRALNANYRIGDADSADRIAQYAANAGAPIDMRVEALDMLADWVKPDPRDRVINDFRPLDPRDVNLAVTALSKRIDSLMITDSNVREKMIDVASRLGIKRIAPELAKRFIDEAQEASDRANSLAALARLDAVRAVTLARGVKLTDDALLVTTAIQTLSNLDKAKSLPTVIQATKSRDMRVRQLAWDLLAKSKDDSAVKEIRKAVQDYLDGSLPSDVHLNVLEAADGKLTEELNQAVGDHQTMLASANPLAKWWTSLEGGNVEKGGKLFFGKTELSCVRCHKVDRAGGEVGPKLTIIGKEKDRRYLLEAICLPNAQIAKGFETAVIADADGAVVTGIVRSETDDFVELLLADGSQVRIEQDDIEARRKGNSSMPDDLTKHMTARELRDLVAYLASLKVDPRGAEDVE